MFQFVGENTPSPQITSPEQVEPSPNSGMQGENDAKQDFIGPKLEGGGVAGAAETAERGDDEDPCRSEGVVQFIIRDFSKLSQQVLSDPTYIRNLPWLVQVYIAPMHAAYILQLCRLSRASSLNRNYFCPFFFSPALKRRQSSRAKVS